MLMQEQQQKKEREIQLLKDQQKELEFMNAMLSDRLALEQRRRFGKSSEKYAEGYEQLCLFNEAETETDVEDPASYEEVRPSAYKRKKRKGKKEEDLSNFEVTEPKRYQLSEEEQYCPECGTKYKVATKEVVKRLKFISSHFEVVEEVTYVYSCPRCGMMKRPEKPQPLIKGSIATPSLVAGIMNAKYVNGMPLARQEREFARYSLNEKITVSGCFAHARRRFEAALTPLKKEFTKEQLKETVAHQALTRIGILYKVEELIRDKTPEERYKERQKQSRPVADALFAWLHSMEDDVDRSSLIGDAVLYTLNQERYLRRYLEDGHLSIDNNSAERAIKNFAVGRHNWLFAKSIRGADASALVYSIVETALLNGLKPYLYLTYVLEKLPQLGAFPKPEELDRLLPWSKELPKELRTKIKSKR